MNFVRRILAASALTALACTAPFDAAWAQSPYFNLRICNRSGVDAFVARAYRTDPDTWMVAGWLRVDAGECANAGAILKGYFYIYAEEVGRGARGTVWRGDDAELCVEYPGPFRRHNTAGYTCGDNELLRGFSASFAQADVGTFTINLN